MCVVFVLPVTLNPLLTYCLNFQERKLLIKTGSYQKRNSTSGRDSTGWATGTRRKEWCCPSLTSRLCRRTSWWVGSSDTHAIGMPVLSMTINLQPWRLALSLICFHATASDGGCADFTWLGYHPAVSTVCVRDRFHEDLSSLSIWPA